MVARPIGQGDEEVSFSPPAILFVPGEPSVDCHSRASGLSRRRIGGRPSGWPRLVADGGLVFGEGGHEAATNTRQPRPEGQEKQLQAAPKDDSLGSEPSGFLAAEREEKNNEKDVVERWRR